MENLNTNDYDLNHIKFLLNFINSNKKMTYSLVNTISSLCENEQILKNNDKLSQFINEFQTILEENSQNEKNLKQLENSIYYNKTSSQENLDFLANLSDTQDKIYESRTKLNDFMPRLFEFIDENITSPESTISNFKNNDLYINENENIKADINTLDSDSSSQPLPLLIISEKNNTITLPSTGEKIPLSYYKYSSWARFREAFKLMRNVENASLLKSLDLAFELSMRYDLHPAIITACKSIDELDVYLSCLDNNTTETFPFFGILFEVSPI